MVHGRRQGEWTERNSAGTGWRSYRCTDEVAGSYKVLPPPPFPLSARGPAAGRGGRRVRGGCEGPLRRPRRPAAAPRGGARARPCPARDGGGRGARRAATWCVPPLFGGLMMRTGAVCGRCGSAGRAESPGLPPHLLFPAFSAFSRHFAFGSRFRAIFAFPGNFCAIFVFETIQPARHLRPASAFALSTFPGRFGPRARVPSSAARFRRLLFCRLRRPVRPAARVRRHGSARAAPPPAPAPRLAGPDAALQSLRRRRSRSPRRSTKRCAAATLDPAPPCARVKDP
jgi:hypothetical protein